MTPEDIKLNADKKRFVVRRRMAISAFVHMIMVVLGVFIVSLVSPESAKSLAEFNSIIIAVIGADVTIIGAYIGAATVTDLKSNSFNPK